MPKSIAKTSGAIIGRHGESITQAIAADPASGKLYVSSGDGVEIFDPATSMSSALHNLSPDAGYEYEELIVRRSNRNSASSVVASTHEFDEGNLQSRDRLLLYRTGQPVKVLVSIPRGHQSPPAVLRGLDLNANNDVLA